MARAKKRRLPKKVARPRPVARTVPEESFPFMSLLPEIRLMVYDALMPEDVHLTATSRSPGLPPTIRALLEVNLIRDELRPHLFERYHFQWTDTAQLDWRAKHFRRFKRLAAPYINCLTVRFEHAGMHPDAYGRSPLECFLGWARWRSLRPHLHPWQLKKLTLVEACDPFTDSPYPWKLPYGVDRTRCIDASRFLIDTSVVPDLDSLKIVLVNRADEEAVKEFLERCASCEIDGRVGYCQYGQEKVSEWFCLQDNQVVRAAG